MSWQDILPLCHSCTPIAHWVGADSSTLRGLGLHFRIHWCSSCRLFEQVLRTAWYSVVIQLLYCRGRLFCRCRTALYSVVTQPLHCRGRLFCSVPLLYTHSSLGGCRPFDTQRPQAALGCRCAGCSATVPCCMARGVMGSCRLFDSQGLRATVGYCRCRLLCRCAFMHGPQIICGVAQWVCRLLDSQMFQAALVQYLQAHAQLIRTAHCRCRSCCRCALIAWPTAPWAPARPSILRRFELRWSIVVGGCSAPVPLMNNPDPH